MGRTTLAMEHAAPQGIDQASRRPEICRFRDARRLCILMLLLLAIWSNVRAQSEDPYCAATPEFSQFDFWVGSWDVFSGPEYEQLVGINVIEQRAGGCLISEYWRNAADRDGHSLRYFDPESRTWKMFWVSFGYSVQAEGSEVQAGVMRLQGTIHYFAQSIRTGFRVRFTANEDGTVSQYAEQQNPRTGNWELWFDGLYRRSSTPESDH